VQLALWDTAGQEEYEVGHLAFFFSFPKLYPVPSDAKGHFHQHPHLHFLLHLRIHIADKYALSSLSSPRLLPHVLSYSKSHIILIAFSIDTPDSLDNVLSKWIEEVRSICGPGIPVMLVGCKKDLRDDAVLRNDGSAEDERRFVSSQKVRLIHVQTLCLCLA